MTIYHVELETHDVLLANGAPAESYRDDGNRWLFQNANSGWDLPPQAPCAPVLTGRPGGRCGLAAAAGPRRAARGLPPMTDDPDLHLLVDGKRVDAVETSDAVPGDGSVLVFRVRDAPRSVCLVSRTVVPAELGIARDQRPLGVALRRMKLRRGIRFEVLQASDARLADGFHAYEASGELRWTHGHAMLPAALFSQFGGTTELVLTLAATTRYPDPGKALDTAAA